MIHLRNFETFFWIALALVSVAVIARGFWLYRASLTWPTANGNIIRLDVQRNEGGGVSGGHYFRAIFSYEFHDNSGHLRTGAWSKNFSTEPEAREFAARELPVGKTVIVRFNPKKPDFNDLELDSWTYTNDRPASLDI